MRRLSRPVLIATSTAIALAGCGHASTQRPKLATYLRHVQRIETRMQAPLKVIPAAGTALVSEAKVGSAGFAGLAVASNVARLTGSIDRQRALRRELAALPAPAEAARLRRLVLRLADRQLALTRQLARLATFLPHFTTLIRSLVPATRQLQAELRTSGTYAAGAVAAVYARKAAALRSFAANVDGISARLGRLHPPAVSRPAYRTQLDSLRGLSAAAGRLADALTAGETTQLPALLLAFDRAATLNGTLASQRAQIAAVKSYDRQITDLEKLVVAIEKERYRLDRTVR